MGPLQMTVIGPIGTCGSSGNGSVQVTAIGPTGASGSDSRTPLGTHRGIQQVAMVGPLLATTVAPIGE